MLGEKALEALGTRQAHLRSPFLLSAALPGAGWARAACTWDGPSTPRSALAAVQETGFRPSAPIGAPLSGAGSTAWTTALGSPDAGLWSRPPRRELRLSRSADLPWPFHLFWIRAAPLHRHSDIPTGSCQGVPAPMIRSVCWVEAWGPTGTGLRVHRTGTRAAAGPSKRVGGARARRRASCRRTAERLSPPDPAGGPPPGAQRAPRLLAHGIQAFRGQKSRLPGTRGAECGSSKPTAVLWRTRGAGILGAHRRGRFERGRRLTTPSTPLTARTG